MMCQTPVTMERGICQDGNRKVAQRKLARYPLYVVGTSVI